MINPGGFVWADARSRADAGAGARLSESWIVAIVAGAVGLVPLFVVRVTPLQDWPSHLARIRVLAEMMGGPSPWSRFYEVHSFLLPNVVLDAVMLGLMKLGLGIDLAGQVFLLLLYLVFVGGFLRLASAFGAGGPLKLMFGSVLFYNGPLFYGLVNFEFGLGLVMLFVGLWYRSGLRGRMVLTTLGTVAVFECHLIAAFLYAGILGSLDLCSVWQSWGQSRGRSLVRSTSIVATGVTLALLLLSPTGHDGFAAVWDGAGTLASFAEGKTGLFAKTLLGGSFMSDIVFAVGAGLLALFVVIGCRLRLPGPVVLTAVAMGLVTVAAPGHMGAGSLLDYRMAVVPWLLLGAGVVVMPRTGPGWRVLLTLMFLLATGRDAALAVSWHAADAAFVALDDVLARLPRESALLVGRGRLARDVPWREYWAYPSNTVTASAVRYGVFVPSVYAHPAQQPLVLKPAYRHFSDFNDVSAPALLDRLRQDPEVRALCHDFPAGVAMVVLFPTPRGLPGMMRVGGRFGLLEMCVEHAASAN